MAISVVQRKQVADVSGVAGQLSVAFTLTLRLGAPF